MNGACTNQAESFFSRLRRAEIGMHHHIAGRCLKSYADEMAWRENNRRRSNGELYLAMADAALKHTVSRQWKGLLATRQKIFSTQELEMHQKFPMNSKDHASHFRHTRCCVSGASVEG